MRKKTKKGRIFIKDGIKGFEENDIVKNLNDNLKEDLAKFHSKVNKKREVGGSKVKK